MLSRRAEVVGVAQTSVARVAFRGAGKALPACIVDNHELSRRLPTTDEWIRKRTGIEQRHIARSGETTTSLALAAVHAAVRNANVDASSLDAIIVATCTADQAMPSCASRVAAELGTRAAAFDINGACSGFAYALGVASSMVSTAGPRVGLSTVCVIGADSMSVCIDPEDRHTAVLFGDGAGAVVLSTSERDEDGYGLLSWDAGSEPDTAHLLEVPAAGFMQMHGSDVFRVAVRAAAASVDAALARAGLTSSDIDLLLVHQANARITKALCERLGVADDRAVTNIAQVANTGSASLAILLADVLDRQLVADGDLVVISGFGAGMTWATLVVRWTSR